MLSIDLFVLCELAYYWPIRSATLYYFCCVG